MFYITKVGNIFVNQATIVKKSLFLQQILRIPTTFFESDCTVSPVIDYLIYRPLCQTEEKCIIYHDTNTTINLIII